MTTTELAPGTPPRTRERIPAGLRPTVTPADTVGPRPVGRSTAGSRQHPADASRRLVAGLSVAASLAMVGVMAQHARMTGTTGSVTATLPSEVAPATTDAPVTPARALPAVPQVAPTAAPAAAQSHAS